MPTTTLLLVTGDRLEVDGTPDEVMKNLENASRSSAGTLARLIEAGSGEPIGVGAAQVVTVTQGED